MVCTPLRFHAGCPRLINAGRRNRGEHLDEKAEHAYLSDRKSSDSSESDSAKESSLNVLKPLEESYMDNLTTTNSRYESPSSPAMPADVTSPLVRKDIAEPKSPIDRVH